MLEAGGVRKIRVSIDQFVSAIGTGEMPVFVCLRSSRTHVNEAGAVKVYETRDEGCHINDGDFVSLILLYLA